MSGRHNNKLPTNLPQLQNLIKRDPKSYTEEVNNLLALLNLSTSLVARKSNDFNDIPRRQAVHVFIY